MSISDLVSASAASSPAVAAAVGDAAGKSAILAGQQSGDTATAALLGAVSTQALTANRLLTSLTGVGTHIDLKA